jgi:hypothetical protein
LNQPRQFTAGYFRERVDQLEDDYDILNDYLLDISPELEEEYGTSPAAARTKYEKSREENCRVKLTYEPSSLNS